MNRLNPHFGSGDVRGADRRAFLKQSLAAGLGAWAAASAKAAPAAEEGDAPSAAPRSEFPDKVPITGTARERGESYGKKFADPIRSFLQQEILDAFNGRPSTESDMRAYAGACRKVIRELCPEIADEMDGIAEGSGLEPNEVVLLTLHEELYHRGVLPPVPHCTAVAIGPPATADGNTTVGQTWDWMQSVYGLSSVVEWRRTEGPSLLAYGFPGLWVGAGMNSNGLALCWTSAELGKKGQQVRVGLPSYVLLAHLLYQKNLDDVVREAKKNRHAGWFTFVMADGEGRLLNVEGSPEGIACEEPKDGRLVRIGFGTRAMTKVASGPIPQHARCGTMLGHLDESTKLGRAELQRLFAEPSCAISVGKGTIDMMAFETTTRTAWLSRGPAYGANWKRFEFST